MAHWDAPCCVDTHVNIVFQSFLGNRWGEHDDDFSPFVTVEIDARTVWEGPLRNSLKNKNCWVWSRWTRLAAT